MTADTDITLESLEERSDRRKLDSGNDGDMKEQEGLGFMMNGLADNQVQEEIEEPAGVEPLLESRDCQRTIEVLSPELKILEAEKNKYVEESRKTQALIAKLEAENVMLTSQLSECSGALEQFLHVVDQLRATKEELLRKLAELVAAEEAKVAALEEAELMKKAANKEKEKNKELMAHISELQEALRSSNQAVTEAEANKDAFFAGIESELLIATEAALQSQMQIEGMREQLEICKNLENEVLEKTLKIDYLHKELMQEKESSSSAAKAAADAIYELNQFLSSMQVMERANSEKDAYIVSLQDDLKKLETELQDRREEVKDLSHQVGKLKTEMQNLKDATTKSNERDLELQVEIATLKSELHKSRSRIAAAEAAEARAKSSRAGLYLAVEKLAIEAEKAKKELQRFKLDTNDCQIETKMDIDAPEDASETNSITISKQEYETLMQKAEKADKIAAAPPKREIQFDEPENTSEVDVMKRELDAANATIMDLRLSLQVADRRAELAEREKASLEDYIRKRRERQQQQQQQRRRSASEVVPEDKPLLPRSDESPGGADARVGRSASLNDTKSVKYLPLSKVLKMDFQ